MDKYKTLVNGTKMPVLNFGTGALQNVKTSVINAIKCGLRAIDTAQSYGNEEEIGQAIKYCIDNNIVKREDLFIVVKLNAHKPVSFDIAKNAFFKSLKKLNIDYADQYLIHAPNFTPKDKWKKINADVWKAFEDLYNDNFVKSIGVSNFNILHIEELLRTAKIQPMVNQIDLNPCWQQRELVEYCQNKNIAISAAYSLIFGQEMNNPLLVEIAKKYDKTVANILLKWSCQKGYMPIFRSSNIEHLKQNIDIEDFELLNEDISKIDTLNSNPTGCGGTTPESWYQYYSILEQLYIVNDKLVYKLFGAVKLFKYQRINDTTYKFYFCGIPIITKKITSEGYSLKLFSLIKIFDVIVRRKRTKQFLPKYED
mgnify:CR=1 FL=1